MRITFLLPDYFAFPIGGYRIVYQHANELVARGHSVNVLFPMTLQKTNASLVRSVRGNIRALFTLLRRRPLVNWQFVDERIALRVLPCVEDDVIPDADAIFATSWQTAALVSKLPSSKGAKCYLVQDYETWGTSSPSDVDPTFRLPLTIVAVSQWLSELAGSKGAESVRYVPNAIDLNLFRLGGLPPLRRPASVLCLYHTDRRKNVSLALRVVSELHANLPDVPISFFGTSPRPSQLPPWIRYWHRPVGPQLATLYNDHSIFLSTSDREGWALPPAEAMACGCAFVGTDSGGPRDFVQHGVDGLLSPPGDQDALVGNLIKVCTQHAFRGMLQMSGAKKLLQYNWQRSGEMMEDVIASVVLGDAWELKAARKDLN